MNSNKFNRDKWKNRIISDVATEINQRIENPHLSEYEKFIGLEDFKSGALELKKWNSTEIVKSAMKIFQKGDVLFARRNAYLKRASFVNFNGVCSGDALVIRPKENEITSKYLSIILNSDKLWDYAISYAAGTMSKRIKWRDLAIFPFLLPPQADQKRIADILYKIEEAVEQSEHQQKTLIDFRKGFIHQIFNTSESFGNLISTGTKQKIKLNEVINNINISEKNPIEKGLSRFIGLEHIESENIKIKNWGNITDGTTFTKMFRKGHVLFGKRRSYLKKAAIVEFDGLCSGDILVFESKHEILLPELLPYIIQNDNFFQYAVTTSAGSLSPRTKWKDLSNFQFYLPDIEIQYKLMDIFKKFENTIEQIYKHKQKLIAFKKGLLNELVG